MVSFHFDAQAGLQQVFLKYDIVFTDNDYIEYQRLNQSLWLQYQASEITAKQLQLARFQEWSQQLSIPAEQLNADFLEAMAMVCKPIDGVIPMLEELSQYAKIGIVTNGFTALQKKRLQNTGINQYIDLLVISEQVGAAKPEPKIFEYVLGQMGEVSASDVLMVGDNLHTDIVGGNRMGFDTCWFNPNQLENGSDIEPTFMINTISDLCLKLEI